MLGGTAAGNGDAFLVKFDAGGNQIWSRQLGSAAEDDGKGVTVDGSGNIYVGGETYGTLPGSARSGGVDVFVAKYDPAGNRLWVKQWGTASSEDFGGIAIDTAGDILVAGYTDGNLGPTPGGAVDAFVTGISPNGSLLWTQQFGTTARDYATGLATDTSGNAYIGGTTEGSLGATNAGGMDVFLAKDAVVPEPNTLGLASESLLLFTAVIISSSGYCGYRRHRPKSNRVSTLPSC